MPPTQPLLESFSKQPNENYPIAVEYVDQLPFGATILSSTLSAVVYNEETETEGASTPSVLQSTSGTPVGTQVRARVQAGTTGVTYKISFVTTLSDGSVLEDDIIMRVANR